MSCDVEGEQTELLIFYLRKQTIGSAITHEESRKFQKGLLVMTEVPTGETAGLVKRKFSIVLLLLGKCGCDHF